MVSALVDASSFELAVPGEVLDGFADLEPGATYYLTALGGMSTTESSTKLGTAYSTQQLAVEVADNTPEPPPAVPGPSAIEVTEQINAALATRRTNAENDRRYLRIDDAVVWTDDGLPVMTIDGESVNQVGVEA